MLTLLSLVTSIGAGLIGGVFFAFSGFVMKALAELPAEQGVAAMQRINVVVLNPLFLGVFVGTALLGLVCTGAGAVGWGTTKSTLLPRAHPRISSFIGVGCCGLGILSRSAEVRLERDVRSG